MSETDALYARLRANYESGDLDDPLLKRAFEDQQPNRELADALEASQGSLRASEEQKAAAEANRRREAQSHSQTLEALRAEHSREIKARDVALAELKKRPKAKPKQKVSYEPGEAKKLKELGWVKRAGD